MRSLLSILTTTTLLTLTISAPLPPQPSSPSSHESEFEIQADIPSSVQITDYLPIVSKIDSPEPTPGTVLITPPPLFDPSEPRPDPLFDSASQPFITAETSRLKAPPIQESRTETLLPFDGAHVHPFATPYTPESLPGTCASSLRCSLARTSLEIGGTLLLLASTIYMLVHISSKIIRRIVWTPKNGRQRSPSGVLRLEPELGVKSGASKQVQISIKAVDCGSPGKGKTAGSSAPLVKVWSEKGDQKVAFVG